MKNIYSHYWKALIGKTGAGSRVGRAFQRCTATSGANSGCLNLALGQDCPNGRRVEHKVAITSSKNEIVSIV